MPGVIVDGQDVDAVREVAAAAIERARAGEGPTLIEAKTYRYRGHSRTDPAKYRAEGELERWKQRDPIDLLGAAARGRRRAQRGRAAGAARRGAGRRSTRPPSAPREAPILTLEETKAYVYAALRPSDRRRRAGVVELTYREAIGAALADELESDPTVLLMGEDVATAGGVFKTNEGLLGAVRPRAGPQHADLRERLPRGRARDGGDRPAAGRRDHVQRLPADGRRRDRQRAAEVPLHVRRPVRRAGHGALDRRRDRPLRHAALGHRRVVVHGPARAQGRDGRHAGVGLRRAARGDPRRRPGALLRAQGPVRAQGPGRARRAAAIARDRQGGRAAARAPTSPSSRRC